MSQQGNTPLPRRDALPPAKGKPFYITGEAAQDLCRLTGLSLNPDGKFLDVSRLSFWDYFRVLWTWVGGNYWCFCNPWPKKRPHGQEGKLDTAAKSGPNQCMGCQADWPTEQTKYGFTIHRVTDGYPHEIVGCTKEHYA